MMASAPLSWACSTMRAMRYDATEFAQGITEVLAYGTAVKIAPAE